MHMCILAGLPACRRAGLPAGRPAGCRPAVVGFPDGCGWVVVGGGWLRWNLGRNVFELLQPHFSAKSTKHDLKLKLKSLSTCRVFEHHRKFFLILP